ncbi:MAG: hypothetical protein Q8S21_03555 [Candidatus Paracaedibacteraceae bacterium]|nr:hypothetical protein [Candidatus Paracaedibacteraceae bacterium]
MKSLITSLIILSTPLMAATPLMVDDNVGNWTATYTLKENSIVEHTPTSTTLIGTNAKPLPGARFQNTGTMGGGSELSFGMPDLNGIPLPHGLYLSTKSTQADFVNALIRSNVYEGTEAEKQAYETSGNWTESFKLKDGTEIVHTPETIIIFPNTPFEIRLVDIQTGEINEMEFKNGLCLYTKSTRTEFLSMLIKSEAFN